MNRWFSGASRLSAGNERCACALAASKHRLCARATRKSFPAALTLRCLIVRHAGPTCIDPARVLSAHVELLQLATVDGLPESVQQTLCEPSIRSLPHETLTDAA